MKLHTLEPRRTNGPAGLAVGRYLSAMVAAVLIVLAIPSSGSAAPLRQARVEGYHEGPWVQTTCTFTDCNTLSKRSSLRWGLSPTHRGVALHSYSGRYRVSMRWMPRKGIYRGELDVGKYWRKRWDLHVVEQRQIDGTWTATKLAGTTRLWTKRAPRYHQTGKFTLHRKFGFGRLVFQASQQLAMMAGDGTQKAPINGVCEGFEPSWRPTTKEVAFINRCGASGTFDVSSINADGTGLHDLLATGVDDFAPDWSNDGRLTLCSHVGGVPDVYVMNADGTGVNDITNDPADDEYPAFSPDGNEIVFTSDRDGDFELYLMNADGTNVRQLTNNPANDGMGAGAWGGGPVWSPNGKLIAFESDRAGKPEIFTLTLATGRIRRVTSSSGSNVTPAISPDGKRIAFSSNRSGGDFDIYTVGLHGEDLIRVSNAPSNDFQPDWVS